MRAKRKTPLSERLLQVHGQPRTVEELDGHALLGFNQPETLNTWPLPGADGEAYRIAPAVQTSSGETLRQLALDGAGIVCLSDFMTERDRESGRLVQILASDTLDMRQPVQAVYYRNTAVSSRIASFVDHLIEALGGKRPGLAAAGWSQA